MAGISVTLEGDNIQLAFQKGDQSTAVVMDPHAARSLVRAVSQLLAAIGEITEDKRRDAGGNGRRDVPDHRCRHGRARHGRGGPPGRHDAALFCCA